eukprot:365561-Chlamydomonas_euryale.AAC.5
MRISACQTTPGPPCAGGRAPTARASSRRGCCCADTRGTPRRCTRRRASCWCEASGATAPGTSRRCPGGGPPCHTRRRGHVLQGACQGVRGGEGTEGGCRACCVRDDWKQSRNLPQGFHPPLVAHCQASSRLEGFALCKEGEPNLYIEFGTSSAYYSGAQPACALRAPPGWVGDGRGWRPRGPAVLRRMYFAPCRGPRHKGQCRWPRCGRPRHKRVELVAKVQRPEAQRAW